MHYNGFYYFLFKGTMKKVIANHYGKQYANQIMKLAKPKYKEIVKNAPDLGKDNPMGYNELFALAFIAPYLASDKKIKTDIVVEMMKESLYHVKWFFSRVDVNTTKGKMQNKKDILKYYKWYTKEKEEQYPTSFKVDFVDEPYKGACYYRITRCPICSYAKTLGVEELMPSLCELDAVMISLQHGVLHRKCTIAQGDKYCDYFILGDKENIDLK